MDQLDTYNQVQALESRRFHYGQILISTFSIVSAFLIISFVVNEPPWWLYLGIAGVLLLAFFPIASWLLSDRKKHCQFCRSELHYITRPMLLTDKYLKMKGNVRGMCFYTQLESNSEQWVKISKQSLACHHCRLIEARQTEQVDKASHDEIEQLSHTPD